MSAFLKMPQTNKLLIAGRAVHEPKYTVTRSDTAIATFAIAVNRGYGDAQEVSFFDVKAFGKTAEFFRDARPAKGAAILIEGRLNQSRWVSKDGEKRSRIEILADRIDLLEWPELGADSVERESIHALSPDAVGGMGKVYADDEVPF